MKHLYFKQLTGNQGIDLWEENRGSSNYIDLSIYFGEWTSSDYGNGVIPKMHHVNQRQIDTFYNLKDFNGTVYFWVFHKETIFCFKAEDLNVFDGPEYLRKRFNLESPKSIKAEVFKEFKKIDLPDFFSNINSNQYYNRTTIKDLKGTESKFADALVNNIPFQITLETFYRYLSPMQFETLLFLIFTTDKSLCSAFRGGTLKDFDLRILLEDNFHGITAGSHWIQAKYKDEMPKNQKSYIAYLGDTDIDNKIIGKEWIINRILERKDILRWLEKSVFENPLINFQFDMTTTVK